MTSFARPVPALIAVLTLAAVPQAHAAALWFGVDARSSGLGARVGAALLPVPFLGTLGLEAGAERGWNRGSTVFSTAVTLRDLNLPVTAVDAFASLGAEFSDAARLYAEGGLRGPLLGPAGWRASARARQDGHFSAGLGLEVRF
ncbi:hypothetical protein [Deinococcus sonorensis]|uniref:Uncharacterized protein n=2 Tax=Deinococcus sonorensis TaxID=309891 RepID=A0AAU7U8W4_9DEIO